MWLFVFFDLPTNTKMERHAAANFRKDLLRSGFIMMQYSVYCRHCMSSEYADKHERGIKRLVPDAGKVSIMRITDKQYGSMSNFWGRIRLKNEEPPDQLLLF